MTLDEAIKVLRQHNVKGASVSRITRGQALEKDLLAQVLDSCEQLISGKAEYKRLLKAAVEDIRYLINHAKQNGKACDRCKYGNEMYCYADDCSNDAKWQHEAEALALIGEDTNVPASADDTNVGHKSGGWISCKDYMPDTLERVLSTMYSDCCLVCDAFGWVGMAYYITNGQKSWWEFADAQNKNKIDWTEVTHWQPVPEPPKDGDT